MAETSIEWCRRPRPDGSLMPGYTFNPWWGCHRISPACRDCYADTWATRVGQDDLWTKDGPRRFFGDTHWRSPLRWQRDAAALGEQHAVFCASMGDVGEDRRDLDAPRERLWRLIDATPNLLWLLLTKRPEALLRLAPWGTGRWPSNVWPGVTVESADYLHRAETILQADAPAHFVSHEPSLEYVDFAPVLGRGRGRVNWLLLGTENSPRARVMPLDRARAYVALCRERGAAPFVKQLDQGLLTLGPKGAPAKELSHLPPDLRVRDWPEAA